jgi:hypothetical protein
MPENSFVENTADRIRLQEQNLRFMYEKGDVIHNGDCSQCHKRVLRVQRTFGDVMVVRCLDCSYEDTIDRPLALPMPETEIAGSSFVLQK